MCSSTSSSPINRFTSLVALSVSKRGGKACFFANKVAHDRTMERIASIKQLRERYGNEGNTSIDSKLSQSISDHSDAKLPQQRKVESVNKNGFKEFYSRVKRMRQQSPIKIVAPESVRNKAKRPHMRNSLEMLQKEPISLPKINKSPNYSIDLLQSG